MTIASIAPTEKQTFLITFKDENILQTVETKVFDSSAFVYLKKQNKRFWNNYLKTGVWRVISKRFIKN